MKNASRMTVYERPGPLSDMFVPHQVVVTPTTPALARASKLVGALLLLIAMPVLLHESATLAYFSDTEGSTGNTMAAGPLDFTVDSAPSDAILVLGEAGEDFVLTVTPVAGSFSFQYKVSVSASGDEAFCSAITASSTAPLSYSGPAASLTTGDTDNLIPWFLTLSLPNPAQGVVDGMLCNLDLTYQGYQEGGASGMAYHDEEHIVLNLVADPPVLLLQNSSSLSPEVAPVVDEPVDEPPDASQEPQSALQDAPSVDSPTEEISDSSQEPPSESVDSSADSLADETTQSQEEVPPQQDESPPPPPETLPIEDGIITDI